MHTCTVHVVTYMTFVFTPLSDLSSWRRLCGTISSLEESYHNQTYQLITSSKYNHEFNTIVDAYDWTTLPLPPGSSAMSLTTGTHWTYVCQARTSFRTISPTSCTTTRPSGPPLWGERSVVDGPTPSGVTVTSCSTQRRYLQSCVFCSSSFCTVRTPPHIRAYIFLLVIALFLWTANFSSVDPITKLGDRPFRLCIKI